MLKCILLENYKCYKSSKLSFKDITIIVGSNNAGKSTLIEAIRLVAYAARKFRNATYKELPADFGLPKAQKGFRVRTEDIDVDLKCVLHQFEGSYARIDATFDSNDQIRIYANQDGAYACVFNANKDYVTSKAKAGSTKISPVQIMPQISPIREEEKRLSVDTVKNHMSTRLSSRHFRNELLLYRDSLFEQFRDLAQKTWDGLRIHDLDVSLTDEPIELLVHDGSFTAEIGIMGSGLQMWLQIMWFLSRCEKTDTIILDEPDVYMHPDMQRRIFNLVTKKFDQVILATHSTEIISNAYPHNLVTIDRSNRSFTYANDIKGAQSIIESLGGMQNLSLLNLGAFKKCILVEGKDLRLLNKICRQLFPENHIDLNGIPHVELGGKGRFSEALLLARFLYEETSGQIRAICILDRDYSTPEEIDELQGRALDNHLELHIWKKKEIENYIVVPDIAFAAVGLDASLEQEFRNEIEAALEELKPSVWDKYSESFHNNNKGKSVATANATAREYVNKLWTTLENKMSLINGKELIKIVRSIADRKFRVRIREDDLIRAMNPENTPKELLEVIQLLI